MPYYRSKIRNNQLIIHMRIFIHKEYYLRNLNMMKKRMKMKSKIVINSKGHVLYNILKILKIPIKKMSKRNQKTKLNYHNRKSLFRRINIKI